MKIIVEDTIEQYEKLFSMKEDKENFYRYSMMNPFEKMWNMINVPLKAKQHNGYDVIMATNMLGYINVSDEQTGRQAVENIKEIQALQTAHSTLNHSINFVKKKNIKFKRNSDN